jgi:NADH dehydrogenase
MADGLADSDGPTTGPTALSAWLAEHGADLGLHYANELERHFAATRPAAQTVLSGVASR